VLTKLLTFITKVNITYQYTSFRIWILMTLLRSFVNIYQWVCTYSFQNFVFNIEALEANALVSPSHFHPSLTFGGEEVAFCKVLFGLSHKYHTRLKAANSDSWLA